MEPDNPQNNTPPAQDNPPTPTNPLEAGPGLPDPSGMNLGSSPGGKKKKNPMMFILIGAVVLILIVIVGVIIAASNSSSKQKTEEKNQYQSGYEAGTKDQKAASEKEYIEASSKDFRIYKAPSEFGSFEIPIPKSWSLAITPKASDGIITGLSDPDVVDVTLKAHVFSFDQKKGDYDKVVADLNETASKSGGAIVASDATVSGIAGRRYKGTFDSKTKAKAEIVIVPLREKYITFRTDDPDKYSTAFNNILNSTKLNP